MYAKRLNKVYPISTAQEKKDYLSRGYDIYNEDGSIHDYSPSKTVPYSQYAALEQKYAQLEDAHKQLCEELLQQSDQSAGELDIAPDTVPPEEPAVEGAPKTLRGSEEPATKMGAASSDKAGKKK